MAETYKGLTIRIGGDTTGLQKSLKSVTSSIAATENQLRRMKSALNMDSGSTSAMSKTIELMGNKAIETNQKLIQLKRSLNQIGNQKVDIFNGRQSTQTIKELADLTADANQRAADAKAAYADITEELAKYYRPINDAVNETKKLDTVAGTAQDAIKQLADDYTRLTGNKKFNAGDFITSSGDEDRAIAQLRELGLISDETADKLVNLREKYRQAFDENETAKAVAQYKDGQVELEKLEASAKAAAKQFSELSRAMTLSKYGEGIDDQLGHIESAARSLEGELKQIDDALKFDPHNVDLLAQKMRDLQEASNLAQAKVDVLDQKLERLRADGADELAASMTDIRLEVERTAQAYDDATAEVKKMEASIRDLERQQQQLDRSTGAGESQFQKLEGDIDSARTALKQLTAAQEQAESAFRSANMAQEYVEVRTEASRARAEVSRFNDEMQEMKRFSGVTAGSLTSLGMSLSTSVTPTLLAAGYGMVQSAKDIDSAYRDMRKTVNGTESDFEELRQAAIDFSTTNVTSADQMLSIQAIGGELGVATEDLKEFAETVSNLDVATDLNAEDAATALGQLQNILHLTGDELAPFSDAIVRLGNNGASTESQIVDIAKRIGSMGAIVGMSAPDILAWASAIASTGQNAEAAGTAISNTMSDIEGAVSGGGDALEAFAQVSQMSAEEFARTWNTDPTEAMKAFIEGLNAIEENGGSADATLSELGITAARQRQAIEGLMQTVDGLDDSLEMSSNAFNGVSDEWGAAGDAAREAEAKAEGFSGSLSRLQNIAQALGAELGESLVPIIDGVADVLGVLFDAFQELPDGAKQAVVALGAVTAALGPMILLGKGISDFFGQISDGIAAMKAVSEAADAAGDLSEAASVAAKSTGLLSTALGKTLAFGGVAVAVGAIAGLVGMYSDWKQKQDNLTAATKGLRDVVRDTTSLDDYANGIESIDESAGLAAMSVDELAESTSKHVQTMQENTDAAESQIAQLNTAQDIINRYAGQTDLTADAQGRLEWALKLVNDQFGLSITQADVASDSYKDQDGNVRNLTDSINKLIEAKKEEARVSALTANLTEAYQIQQDAGDTLTQAEKNYEDAINRYIETNKKFGREVSREQAEDWAKNSAGGGVKEYRDLQSARSQFDNAAASVTELETDLAVASAATSDLADEFDKLTSTMGSTKFDQFNSQLKASGTNFEMLKDDLRSLGVNTEQFSDLEQEELRSVANAYDGTAASIIDVLDDLGVSMDDTGRQAAEMAVGVRDCLSDMAGGTVGTKLEELGYDLSDLSQKMAEAGISSSTLKDIGAKNFDLLATMAGDDVNKLIYLIQNYNQTPIADKNGNINVSGEEIVLYANGQMYTWNGINLKDQNGNIVIQGTPELHDANGEIYTWNNSGQLADREGNILVNATTLYDANDEIYEFDGLTLYKEGQVVVDQLELTDAYDNCVKLTGYDLTLSGEVNCNYDEVTQAISAAQTLLGYNGRSATVTLNSVTRYRTIGTPSGATSGSTPAFQSLGQSYGTGGGTPVVTWPSTASTLAAKAATINDGVSLMSAEAARAARSISKAPWSIASTAAEVVRSAYGESAPGNRRELGSDEPTGKVINNYYDVTVDGNGTTSRVQQIALELLDALEIEGRI